MPDEIDEVLQDVLTGKPEVKARAKASSRKTKKASKKKKTKKAKKAPRKGKGSKVKIAEGGKEEADTKTPSTTADRIMDEILDIGNDQSKAKAKAASDGTTDLAVAGSGEDDSVFDDIIDELLEAPTVPATAPDQGNKPEGPSPVFTMAGVGPATAAKLIAAGYSSPELIAYATERQLVEKAKLTRAMALHVLDTARADLNLTFETATVVLDRRKTTPRVGTGSVAFDELLHGGYEARSITELFGEYRTGKSQLCFQAAYEVAKPKSAGGLEAYVVFIDTEGTFRPERVIQMAEADDLEPAGILQRIIIGRAYNTDHQLVLGEEIAKQVREKDIRLVIVDSLTSHFRSEYIGKNTLVERQQKLNRHLHQLLHLSEAHEIAVIVTNQVQSRPGSMPGDEIHPVGGHVVAHTSTTRIFLRVGRGNRRVARLVDSPNLPEGEAMFCIAPEGIIDV